MTKGCSQVLRELRKLTCCSDVLISQVYDEPCFRVIWPDGTDACYDYGKWSHEIASIIHQLEKDGYVIEVNNYQFYLSQKGTHPYKDTWDTIKAFLFKSVLVPIVVSTATALLTLWLKGLL